MFSTTLRSSTTRSIYKNNPLIYHKSTPSIPFRTPLTSKQSKPELFTVSKKYAGYRRNVNKQVLQHIVSTNTMMPYRQTGLSDLSIFPPRFQRQMEKKGYFQRHTEEMTWEYHLEPHFKQALTYQPILGGVRTRVLNNWVDKHYFLKKRDLRHPDYPMYADKYRARLYDVSWDDAHLLVEKLFYTKQSLQALDAQHRADLWARAPGSSLMPSFGADGKFQHVRDPPNAPLPPRRPRTNPIYPWKAPVDFVHVKHHE